MRAGRTFRAELERIKAEAEAAMMPAGSVTLALDAEGIEALAVGARLLMQQGDPALGVAAGAALARLRYTVPEAHHPRSGLGMTLDASQARDEAMTAIAAALRTGTKLRLLYADASGRSTARTVWPVAVIILEHARLLAAWCEMRGDWRHFRLDRMTGLHLTGDPLPRSGLRLLHEWRSAHEDRWEVALVCG